MGEGVYLLSNGSEGGSIGNVMVPSETIFGLLGVGCCTAVEGTETASCNAGLLEIIF